MCKILALALWLAGYALCVVPPPAPNSLNTEAINGNLRNFSRGVDDFVTRATGGVDSLVNKANASVSTLSGNVAEGVNKANASLSTLTGSVAEGVSKATEGAASLSGAVAGGFKTLSGGIASLGDMLSDVLGAGKKIEDKLISGAQIPLKLMSGMAYLKMDNFESYVEASDKQAQINKKMSDFVKSGKFQAPDYFERSGILNDEFTKAYRNRCVGGDCFTFDLVTVFTAANKVCLKLPRLAQVDYAFAVFRQSGALEEDGLLQLASIRENYNSFDHFVFLLAKHNVDKLEFLNVNDEAVNTFYHRATLFYKKFTLESKLNDRYDATKTFGAVLGFYIKSDLLRLAELSTYNKSLTMSDKDFSELTDYYRKYLSDDPAAFVSIADAYSRLCQECLQDTHEDNRPNVEMVKFLKDVVVDPEQFCMASEEGCVERLDRYLSRCNRGDCYTFDNLCITENIRLKVLVPHFAQVKLALFIFKKSKAHRGHGIVGFFKRLFRMEVQKTLRYFVKMLARHNIRMLFFNDQAEKVLNTFLYHATLFFGRFLSVSRMVKFYSLGKFTLWMFSLGRERYLKNLAKDITFGTRVALSGQNLSKIVDEYSQYLVDSNLPKHAKISEYFAQMCKRIILNHVSEDKIANDMFDASAELKAEEVCGNSTRFDCLEVVTLFLKRCKEGDCYTLDTRDYYTPDKMYKITLPVLQQVDAAIYAFKHSKSYGSYLERVADRLGPNKKVDPYVVFYRSLVTHNDKFLTPKTFDNEVLTKYLFNASVYFKFVNDNRMFDSLEVNKIEEYDRSTIKVETFLRRLLKSLVGVERVKFENLDMESAFAIFDKHMTGTQEVRDATWMNNFIGSCKKIFKMFRDMQNDKHMFARYTKGFDYY